jgi:hypothetical protein
VAAASAGPAFTARGNQRGHPERKNTKHMASVRNATMRREGQTAASHCLTVQRLLVVLQVLLTSNTDSSVQGEAKL